MTLAQGLCQPGGGASCGACCGLYNFADHSREALTAALSARTERLRDVPRTPSAYHAAARGLAGGDAPPLFSEVRVCPLLGFLDPDHTRVGCLAHPAFTGGADLRDCGVYDARTCHTFECPSFLWLDDAQAALIRAACPDWYLYGLVVTDVELVRGCLRLISEEAGGTVAPDRIRAIPAALDAFSALLALKERAPGRARGAAVFGRFAPDGEGDAALRTIDYGALAVRPAPEDDVVLCLGHAPGAAAELEAARARVRSHVAAVATSLRSG